MVSLNESSDGALVLLCCCRQGYGDLHAYSVAEAAYVVVFMFVSLGVTAYFVGTSVLLVVENEKKTGAAGPR
jgi:hypothetical protein